MAAYGSRSPRTRPKPSSALTTKAPASLPEHVERIFDRFFSYRPIAAQRPDHDGLGFAIARSIIEAYGGTIRAMNLTP
jgi:hypothetical protein